MPPKKRKKKSKIYFGTPVQEAIIRYNDSDSDAERNKIYRDEIQYAFDKLAENIIHTFKFYYFDYDSERVKHEVVSFLVLNMHKYQPDKGRAFSYFSIIAKNYLILNNNNNYKRYKIHTSTDKMELERNYETEKSRKDKNDQDIFFLDSMVQYMEVNLPSIFKRKKDIVVADSIVQLIRSRENIENFNKKSIYVLLREMTGSNTQHITRIMNVMKKHYFKLFKQFNEHGYLEISGSKHFY